MLVRKEWANDMKNVVLFEGDGIGPEIIASVIEIFNAAKVEVSFHKYNIGKNSFEEGNGLIPLEAIKALKKYKVALKGPVTTPIGKGFRSVNVELRLMFDLFCNKRPCYGYEGVCKYPKLDIVIFRENTEDLYIGEEREIEDGFEAIKRITVQKTKRLLISAFEYAKKNHKKITCVHKANILKKTDGLFLKLFNELKEEYEVEANDRIIDNMCMQLVTNPYQFEVIVAPNLYGDILSDLVAGLCGGLGLVPGANIGSDTAIFEAVHGSAPDIAGLGIANPIAMILSACMMLEHIGYEDKAIKIRAAIDNVIKDKKDLTKDLNGEATTKMITDAIIARLKKC